MKKLITLTLHLSLIMLLMSCEVKPQEINFGSDNCHFCKMTIVDAQHAAEVVTTKGKVYKYDAIECMMNHMADWEGPEIQLFLVSNYSNHSGLIDAKTATYLICEKIPSPMGANLSAFQKRENAVETKNKSGGELLDWQTLKERYNR